MTQDTNDDAQNTHDIIPETTACQVVSTPLIADGGLSLRVTIDIQRHPGYSNLGGVAQQSTGNGGLDQKHPGRGLPPASRSTDGGGLDQKQPGDSRRSEMKPRH